MTKTEITTAEPLVVDPNAPVLFIDDVAAFGMVGIVVHPALLCIRLTRQHARTMWPVAANTIERSSALGAIGRGCG